MIKELDRERFSPLIIQYVLILKIDEKLNQLVGTQSSVALRDNGVEINVYVTIICWINIIFDRNWSKIRDF